MNEQTSRRTFLKVAAATALAPAFSTLEALASKKTPSHRSRHSAHREQPAQRPAIPDYSHLDVYDGLIGRTIKHFQSRHGVAPEANLVKAIIQAESGGYPERTNSFVYDPMQIASDGNARGILAAGGENTPLIGDFSFLRGTRNAVRRKGRWNYSGTGMNTEKGIVGGIGWLYHKAADYEIGTVEGEELREYKTKKGDSFSNLASKLGTTKATLRKYNPTLNPKKFTAGQTIKYRTARREVYIAGFADFNESFPLHNGIKNPKYRAKVLSVKRQLDARD